MALAANLILEPRWQRKLRSAEFLWIDLDDLGMHVSPRTGPGKRDQGEKNDYVFRRLLVASAMENHVNFPLDCTASPDSPELPDFVLRWPDGVILGVEVTEAGAQSWQAKLTDTERSKRLIHESINPDQAVQDLRQAIEAKVSKFEQGWYRDARPCDLAVYDNAEGLGWLDKSKVIEALGRPAELIGRFRQVHLVTGGTVYLDIFSRPLRSVWIADRYEIDFFRWTQAQAAALREWRWDDVDIDHLAEEIESMGRRDRRAFFSQLQRLMVHFLKWTHQPAKRERSWQRSINDARDRLAVLEDESPSLVGEGNSAAEDFQDRLNRSYAKARRIAADETDLPIESFPDSCPYTMEQLRDEKFLPDGKCE
jgi:hypothetical protein